MNSKYTVQNLDKADCDPGEATFFQRCSPTECLKVDNTSVTYIIKLKSNLASEDLNKDLQSCIYLISEFVHAV